MVRRDLAKVQRLAATKRQQAERRTRVRNHAKCWNGLASQFRGFGNREFSSENAG